jgi:hypothetical protein
LFHPTTTISERWDAQLRIARRLLSSPSFENFHEIIVVPDQPTYDDHHETRSFHGSYDPRLRIGKAKDD